MDSASKHKPQQIELEEGSVLFFDVSLKEPRLLVPSSLQRQVFDVFHGLAHQGWKATKKAISSTYFWPSLAKDFKTWAQSCTACQRNKVGRHIKTPLQHLPLPSGRFKTLHVDIVSPLNPPSRGMNSLFTIIDSWTGFMEAYPMSLHGSAASAEACARHLVRWCANFGMPKHLISDRGPQFTSGLWRDLCQLLGVEHHTTSAYHPQANGRVERMHRTLKNALRSRLDGAPRGWTSFPSFSLASAICLTPTLAQPQLKQYLERGPCCPGSRQSVNRQTTSLPRSSPSSLRPSANSLHTCLGGTHPLKSLLRVHSIFLTSCVCTRSRRSTASISTPQV